MVTGIDKFREYFKDFAGNYTIIGGTACDIILDDAGFNPRSTKDIDIVLIVEALTSEFVKQFWAFVKEAKYKRKEISPEERKYYRFIKPENKEFPKQLEFFSRIPDLINLDEGDHLTPIPIDDDISSLSAILLNEEYYYYTIEHSTIKNEINIANSEALICLKAKAFLDLTEQKTKGKKIDAKNILKHKTDVFRMASMLATDNKFELPANIKADMQNFVNAIKTDLPRNQIFKNMGIHNMNIEELFMQLSQNFNL